MTDYPKDEQGRKKALAAQESFCKKVHDNGSTETYLKCNINHEAREASSYEITKAKEEIESWAGTVNILPPRAIDFLYNASWHLTQALKIIDEVEK